MVRQIIFHGNYFLDFYKELDTKAKLKIQYVFELIKQVDRVPEKFLSPMKEIEKAKRIMKEYFESKKLNHD